ncbi:hypothetical protein EDB87DRAFT_1686947 [Lactarius vividus]|nr:hypothetical protein EDB87DRAFT_1686947 [Lactarius vividus]
MQHPDPPPDPPSDNNSFLFNLYSTPPPFQDPTTPHLDSLITESPDKAAIKGNSNDNHNIQPNPPSDSNTYLFDLFSTPPASQIHSEQTITSPVSPQDSQMGSPESEEPTNTVIPQEEIVVFPRSASHTPRVISRPLSVASNWSHMSKEESETSPLTPNSPQRTYRDAALGRTLPDAVTVPHEVITNFKINLTDTDSTEEGPKFFHDNNKYLADEIIWEVNEASLGYGMYYLNEPKLALHKDHDSVDLQHPITQGDSIKRMALQLAKTFDNSRRNLAKQSLSEFFDQILDIHTKALTKAVEAQAELDFNPSDYAHTVCDKLLNDKDTLDRIHEEVKNSIFAELNKEVMEDLDTWREIYREEFKEVMQQYIALNKFGMDPCFIKADPKGKKRAKSATPEMENSIREIEHIMRIDCQAQIDAMRNNTLQDMALQMQNEIAAYRTAKFTRLQAEALHIPSPVKFVAWSPAKDPLDADAQAAEEAEARERLWKFHQSRALHLRAAILATQYMFPQDPPQGPED